MVFSNQSIKHTTDQSGFTKGPKKNQTMRYPSKHSKLISLWNSMPTTSSCNATADSTIDNTNAVRLTFFHHQVSANLKYDRYRQKIHLHSPIVGRSWSRPLNKSTTRINVAAFQISMKQQGKLFYHYTKPPNPNPDGIKGQVIDSMTVTNCEFLKNLEKSCPTS